MYPVMVRTHTGGTDIVVFDMDNSGLWFLLCIILALILFVVYKLLHL
nr:E5 BETA [human papillomavirus 81]WAB54340.1 E5 BETA [human papillomavirus 81]WBF83430.1 MAG: E5 BETA protein [human papillomavirus 81]